MGKGDIRTRRGKVWRGTYGVTRPRRWKTVARPAATTRKVKTLKDLPKAAAQSIIKKPVVETAAQETVPVVEQVQPVIAGITAEVPQIVAEPITEMPVTEVEEKTAKKAAAKKPAAKKATTAKKPAAKKAPAKKK